MTLQGASRRRLRHLYALRALKLHGARLAVILSAAACVHCTVPQKESLLDTALSGDSRRAEYFEAMLRVLDEHPAYVDQLFERAQSHPKTLDRMLADTAQKLEVQDLAQRTADDLARNPRSLHQILVSTLDAARHNAKAKQAIAEAIEERSGISTETMVEHPSALRASFESMVDAVSAEPQAQQAFLESMQKKSPEIARLLESNPKTLRVLVKALLHEMLGRSKEDLKSLLEELGM